MRRNLLSILVGLVVLMAMVSIAYAQNVSVSDSEGAATLWTGKLADAIFDILTPIVSLFAMWVTHRLIGVFETKTNIDIPEKEEKLIDKWVLEGIHWGEEKSRNKIKEKSAKLAGREKLGVAVDYALGLAQSKGLVNWTRDKIEGKVESALGMKRANGGKPRLDADNSPDAPEA